MLDLLRDTFQIFTLYNGSFGIAIVLFSLCVTILPAIFYPLNHKKAYFYSSIASFVVSTILFLLFVSEDFPHYTLFFSLCTSITIYILYTILYFFQISIYRVMKKKNRLSQKNRFLTPFVSLLLIFLFARYIFLYLGGIIIYFLIILLVEIFRLVVTLPHFSSIFYETFVSFLSSISCLVFSHSFSLYSHFLISLAHLSGCFLFASS